MLEIEPSCILKEFLNEVKEVQFSASDLSPLLQVVSTPYEHGTLQIQSYSSQRIEEFQKSIIGTIANMIEWQVLENVYFDFRGQFRDTVLASDEFTALATSLTGFVARPHFRTLDIRKFQVPAHIVMDILSAFLVSPCSHQQTLKLPQHIQPSTKQLHPTTPYPAGAMPVPLVPDSGVEYKELYLHQQLLVDESYTFKYYVRQFLLFLK